MQDRTVDGPAQRELSRRDFLQRAGALGAGAVVLSALPLVERMIAADPALAAVAPDDATLQAFADTILPGRPAERTDLGDEIHPGAIAGVDTTPGAVEADVLRIYRDDRIGFPTLAGPFLSELTTRSVRHGGPFLTLPFDARTRVVLELLSFDNPSRVVHEAAAAIPFVAFCAASAHPIATSANASGYRTMGYPGAAPNGYPRSFSYRRRLSRERTRTGSLP